MNIMKKRSIFFIFTLLSLFLMRCERDSNPPDEIVPPTDEDSRVTTKNPIGGICPSLITWMTDIQLNTFLNEFATAHALYIRIDLPWSVIQPDDSTTWNFTDYDRVFNAIVAKGFKILALPTYCPSWANGGFDDDKYPPTAAHATDWYNFVKKCADRYIPIGVDSWEMWNEPNITGFWEPVCNVADYTNIILKNGSDAVRASASALGKSVTVISGGLSPAATDGQNIHPLDFLTGIYANGGKSYMDAIGHHPYCFPESPYSTVEWSCFQMTPKIYQIMVNNGDGDKKIWGTEFGYHTGNDDIGGVTQDIQAQYVTDAYSIWHRWKFTGPLCWYDYQDLGTDLSDREQCFGLKLFNGENKQGWLAYKNVMISTMPPGVK
jgi:polysaccharide biosynthesis protein PslG